MSPSLLCELLAALMYEYLDRASCALSEQRPDLVTDHHAPPRHFFDTTLLPAWMNMLADFGLPLEPPDHDKADALLTQLADYLRKSAQETAVRKELEGGLDDPTGVLN